MTKNHQSIIITSQPDVNPLKERSQVKIKTNQEGASIDLEMRRVRWKTEFSYVTKTIEFGQNPSKTDMGDIFISAGTFQNQSRVTHIGDTMYTIMASSGIR